MPKDKRCVFVADTQASAQGISHWLESCGIENFLMDKTTLGMSNGVSFTTNNPAADGWQVWVKDHEKIDEAISLLDERQHLKAKRADLGPVESRCESCGTVSEFAGEQRGSIQDCPQCGRYMDVGGLDDEYEWPESFGD